jgi:hypothetical protein
MKTQQLRFTFLILIFMVVNAVSSCKKDEKPEPVNPGISYIVNGTAKSSVGEENVQATLNKSSNTLTLTSKITATGESVILVIPGIRGRGEFPFPESATATYSNGIDANTNIYTATSGKVKITTFQSNGVKGSFEFYSVNKGGAFKNITEGSFEAMIK